MRWTLVVLLAAGVATGCSKNKRHDAVRSAPKSATELPTTRADIYFANLDGQIDELTRVTKGGTVLGPDLLLLASVHHQRGRFRGDLDEIQQGIDLVTLCTKQTPDNATCWLMRADQEQSLHRFGEAEADLARAKAGGAPKTAALQADLDWNAGRYDVAIPAIREARRDHPSTATWIREAQLEHDLGHEAEADRAFVAAEDAIVDTGPLVVAHLDVQRGMQKVATGKLDEALVFFRAAVERIPDWVAANEHLAETLAMAGKDDEATRIYEKVVHLSDDPEFAHALAELYAKHGKDDEARALDIVATARYEALLAKYPEAMYWHASEFFLSIGDAARAVSLLEKNVALRPNSTSWVALARAQLAAKQDARAAIDKALAMPVVSAVMFWTAARVHAGSPDGAKYAKRAKEINPRIAVEEPPL